MVAAEQEKKQAPDFRPGDTLRVHIRVVEGESERIQAFEGICLLRRGHGDSESFTVRKVSFGVGVERTFPLFSPHIDKIEVVKSGKVRRAKLYYLRKLTGRAARLSEQEGRETAAPPAAAAGAEKLKHHEAQAAAPEAALKSEDKPGQKSGSAPADVVVKAGSAIK